MANEKPNGEHIESSNHEAVLTGVIALASLFSNCVEAFGLIHPPAHKERRDQILLTLLGIEQARLLIWGDVVGVSSPPATVTDRAVPKYPSAAYPDLTEPTFFGPRDARLDEVETRKLIEDALNALADRSANVSREQMMAKYGLKPPKGNKLHHEPALDAARLEGFREKYELLKEVVESYAKISVRRSHSIIDQSWTIVDAAKFEQFVKLVREKVDFLINLMGIKERIDRAMRVDIRSFGWHMIDDRNKSMQDKLKLGLINDACKGQYPEYQIATQQALEQISREYRERAIKDLPAWTINPYERAEAAEAMAVNQKQKRPGLFSMFRSFNKAKSSNQVPTRPSSANAEPVRSMSDVGPGSINNSDDYEPIRSKSLGHILEPTDPIDDDELVKNTTRQNSVTAPVNGSIVIDCLEKLHKSDTLDSTISRHDQYLRVKDGLGGDKH